MQPTSEVVRTLSRRAVPLDAYAGIAAALACDCLLVRPRRREVRRCLMDLAIRRDASGEFVLDWVAAGGEGFGVSWHDTLAEALAAAERAFGIAPVEWRDLTIAAGGGRC